jgi:hypothetical protein
MVVYPFTASTLLDPPKHGSTNVLQVFLGKMTGPQDLDVPDELG